MAIFNNPYPLLDNELGNFINSRFDCELIEDELVDGFFKWVFKADITDPVLIDLIKEGKATFAIKIQCSPIYVETVLAKENWCEVEVKLHYSDVPADFSFNFTPLILSLEELVYRNENASFPMSDYNFKIGKYQVLGSHRTQKIKYDQGYKAFDSGPLVKLVELEKGKNPEAGDFDIDLSQNFNVKVKVAQEMFAALRELNVLDSKVLDRLLALPILQFVLHDLSKSETNRDREWAVRLNDEFDVFDLDSSHDVLKKSNEILNGSLLDFAKDFKLKYTNND
jgi:hypothetical protein